jgi:UDP-N-acetyl-D-glucosamine dehydrogenase
MLANDLSVLPQQAQQRLENRTAHIGVIGLGYVGLPLSLLLAENGFRVTGFDIDNRKVTEIEQGRSYIYRIPETSIQLAREQGFRATSEFSRLPELDAIIICVPTPLTEHREPDLTYIESTARTIAPWLQPGQLVVLESTTFPGTTEELLIPILEGGNLLSIKAPAR